VGGGAAKRELLLLGLGRRGHDERERHARDVGAGVGDVGLAAVDDPVVALLHAARLEAGRVGAGIGLGAGERTKRLARDDVREVANLLLGGAEALDDEPGRDAHHHGHGEGLVALGDLLDGKRHVEGAEAEAAELLGERESRNPELAELAVEAIREGRVAVELFSHRCNLAIGKFAYTRLDVELVGGEFEVHVGARGTASMRESTSGAHTRALIIGAVQTSCQES
jgi:hypothetical protein